ncbi:lysophospholipid acyltransferase family protein [Actinoplanes sp. Pm04-4]|uniref:Lysophospholipid acyltransferase family protein n=1 Tax=Paractinoplanes pyxinae TaxID=2997416 RepID=A0ABT4B5W9_9ACTN|nr:lysophospholipid acyltransferase family protein [Actinoplanes pyxinae]MCY1141905.1 lysophospholipid acyltransferase family protein [Actinoplanes pyxinae]
MSSVYWLAHSGIAVAGRTPPRVRHMVASTVTSASYLGWRSKRLITRENMATVLGLPVTHPSVRRIALNSWSNYGRTAASLACLPYVDLLDVDARIQDLTDGIPWHGHLQSARAAGKGLIITTGHFGSWDLAGAIAARHVPLSAVVDTFGDARLDDLLQGHRRDRSVQIIPVSGAPRGVLREMTAGRAVAIVVDRPVTGEHGVEVSFFGRPTRVPAGAGALAVKSGAAVVPGYFWYGPKGAYYMRTFPPMYPQPVSSKSERQQEVQRLTQYMFDCQEEVVRHSPAQWFMFRRFWPGAAAPSGEAGRRTSSRRIVRHRKPD